MSTKQDPHHCHCFSIDEINVKEFEKTLLSFGFKDQIQEDHGQAYGYRLKIEEQLQLHIKVMPKGNIEAEMEPPPAYIAAHLNQEHSYSAHNEVEQILRLARIRYHIKLPIPETCLKPKIKKPIDPTHAAGFILAGIIGIAAAVILKKLLEDKDDEE